MRELLRPRQLLGHVLVLSVAIICVVLGQWQLDELAEIRDHNARSEQRLEQPPVDLAALADPNADASVDEAELEYRRVAVTGTYRPEQEVLQRNRSFQNQTGFHLLTPLELSGGGVVLVRRGWVPADLSDPPVAEAAPEPDEVSVVGTLERPVGQPDFGPTDPADGVLERVFHADTARLDAQIDGELFPMVLRVEAVPGAVVDRDELPIPPGAPTLDERNHLSYAVQWHVFALLALGTYVAWLWTRIRSTGDDPPDGSSPGGSSSGGASSGGAPSGDGTFEPGGPFGPGPAGDGSGTRVSRSGR